MSTMSKLRKCVFITAVMCMVPTLSWAVMCFLPTGECESGAQTRSEESKSCADYVTPDGPYYLEDHTDASTNTTCELVNRGGCSLYFCTVSTCQQQGFLITDREKKAFYPEAAYDCKSCKQGNSYWWNCPPKPCSGTYVTEASCDAETETFKAVEGAGRSGHSSCGECIKNTDLSCPDGTTDYIPTGCYACDPLTSTGPSGKICYKCHRLGNDYMTEAEYNVKYENNFCVDRTEKATADGGLCYKAVDHPCPIDIQYKKFEIIEGKEICKCYDYEYEFSANPTSLRFTAAGGDKVINVVSKRIGNEEEPWEYSAPTKVGNCTITKFDDHLAVNCPTNPTTTVASETLTIAQSKGGGIDTRTIVINVVVDADKCMVGQLEKSCSDTTKAPIDNGTTSDAGQTCYNCVNNTCDPGYTPGKAPEDVGYEVYRMDSGELCHKRIETRGEEEKCPAGSDTATTSCTSGYHIEKVAEISGVDCNKCVSDSCPAGKTCTDDKVCPSGMSCPDTVDCKEIAIGDTIKYYDCKCKDSAIACDSTGYKTDEQNCECVAKRCDVGYDERITSCESGWKLDTPKGKSGDLDCNRCVEETCPSGQTCKPWPYCEDGTDCTPNPNIECDTIKIGANTMYTDCVCKINAGSCGEGFDFDSNRCECREKECPVGYKTEVTSCTRGYDFDTKDKSGDKDCGKCTAKTCPTGQTCTTDKICPNGQSCPDNPDIECESIMLGDEAKYTNCRCKLSGSKEGYVLDEGYCKWNPAQCEEGYVAETPNCLDGYHPEYKGKSGEVKCTKCEANTCPAGKTCLPYPIAPDNSDATGNNLVKCTKVKLGANIAYYDCTCLATDALCGTGKKANTRACICESCEGTAEPPAGPYTCETLTCGGQMRYKNCIPWGNHWKIDPVSKCNTPKQATDGKTYYNTTEICQCKIGYNSSNCGGKCSPYEKCMPGDTTNDDGATCYVCKDDECDAGLTKNPGDCVRSLVRRENPEQSTVSFSYKHVDTTEAGTKCYRCVEECVPGDCSSYDYAESEFITSNSTYYKECDPGCNGGKRYKCVNATATKQPSGKYVCVPNGKSSNQNLKESCDDKYSGWTYLGSDYQGSVAAKDYQEKYKWPAYFSEIGSCSNYFYGRYYSSVCGVYSSCDNSSANLQCYATNTTANMENLGYCCVTSGNRKDVYGVNGGIIGTTNEYCCYQGEGCPKSRVPTEEPKPDNTPKCSSGTLTENAQSALANFAATCQKYNNHLECKAHPDTSDYLCCTCTR